MFYNYQKKNKIYNIRYLTVILVENGQDLFLIFLEEYR